MATEPPAPSPAPTLDEHFPGYYPPTPSVVEDDRTLNADRDAASASTTAAIQPETSASSPSGTSTASTTAPGTEDHHETTNQERLIGAGKALLGAAAGFVVGGTVGAAAGAGLVGMTQVEQHGIEEQLHHSKDGEAASHETATTTDNAGSDATFGSEAKVPHLDSHAAFGTPAVEKERAELEHSPAQQLLAQADNSSHDKQKGKAILLAGAAGAHNVEHEVAVPGTETNVDSEPPTPKASTTALVPAFGTPAVEKERSELEHSPAQRLLAETASSSSAATPPLSAEAALLGAAAAGATAVGRPENEVEEPATKPIDEAVVDDLNAGGGVPSHSAGQTGEVVPATALGQETASTERPSLPTPSGSLESFSGAVLAAGSSVETPSVAPGPAVSGFGDRGSGLIYLSDRDIEGNGAKESPEDIQKEAEAVPLPVDTPGARSDVSFPTSDQTEKPREERDHTTGLATAAATSGALAGSTLINENAPKDFEPYTPPALPESTPRQIEDDQDDTPHPTAAEKGKGRAFDVEETLAVAAAAGGGGFATAVGMKSFASEATKEANTVPSSAFTENLDTPTISATAKDPLWDQRAELPPTAQVTQHEPHRALDPQVLAAEAAPAASPEQAGFTGIAPGAEPTPAMQDFAHLSQPAPAAEETALRTEPKEQDEGRRSEVVPVAAAAGMAGIGAGAASTRLLAHEQGPMATPPRAAGGPASLSRFTEDTTRTGSPLEVGATPSSTQAVMGSPAPHLQQGSPTPMVPSGQQQGVIPGSVVPQRLQQQGIPPQHLHLQPTETSNIERSPHMKIATNVVDGHKRLHRKSLSKGTPNSARSSGEFERPGSGAFVPIQQPPVQNLPPQRTQQAVTMPHQQQQPVTMPQQSLAAQPQSRFVPAQQPHPQVIPSNAAASGPTGAAGARPPVPVTEAEARRDRMMTSMVGVRDPIVTGPPIGETIPAGAPVVTARILPSHEASLSPPAAPSRTESDASAIGQHHNETRQGVPPMAVGITAVTAAVIPGMATLPPVGGMPISQQRQQAPPRQQPQQQQMPVGGPGMAAPPSTIGSGRTEDSGVQRKLSKKHPHEPVEKERKEGFFSKIFGGGSGRHSRNGSQNSRNGVPVSPRNSTDLRRE